MHQFYRALFTSLFQTYMFYKFLFVSVWNLLKPVWLRGKQVPGAQPPVAEALSSALRSGLTGGSEEKMVLHAPSTQTGRPPLSLCISRPRDSARGRLLLTAIFDRSSQLEATLLSSETRHPSSAYLAALTTLDESWCLPLSFMPASDLSE